MTDVAEVVDRAFRDDAGRAVAALIGVTHDFDLAEEALQDACEQALRTWPQRGLPDNPSGWLFTTARNLSIDAWRRRSARVGEVITDAPPEMPTGADETDRAVDSWVVAEELGASSSPPRIAPRSS